MKVTKLFSSKANTLSFLKTQVRLSKIEYFQVITVKEWNECQKKILLNIKNNFSNKIIIRSSAEGEDSFDKSEAGKFESILNLIPSKSFLVKNAINDVVKSYGHKDKISFKHQIIIQKQTLNSQTSGVIFSKTPENGSPYYVINYEDSNLTDTVTKGLVGNTLKIYRETPLTLIPKKWKKLILAIQEIEKITKNDKLDIEFAITPTNIIIFQVRPLTMIKNNMTTNVKKAIHNEIIKNQKKITRLEKTFPSTKHLIFSNMADWNPAEIIGSHPNRLDYSLYDFLIMKDSWSKGRELLGYNNPKICLMEEFSGKPFVNVNASFLSLIPSNIGKNLQRRLINYYSKKLRENPYLHDKIEFEILFTCYDFNFKERIKDLVKNGFTKRELITLKKNLIEFTNQLIKQTPKIIENTTQSLKSLEIQREINTKKSTNYRNKLLQAEKLLKDCKKFGTIQFSAIARLAFVSRILLDGLPNISNVKSVQIEKFMNSISTPVTDFQNDLFNLKMKKMKKNQFLEKYGHLRPGTYDITINRYDKMPKFIESLKFLDGRKKSKPKSDIVNIDKILKNHGLNFEYISFFDFIKETISLRERSKFEFTKTLSDAIELIIESGIELGFTRNDLSNLSIVDILKYKNMKKNELIFYWKKKIIKNEKYHNLSSHIQLPPIFFSKNDLSVIQHYVAKPNFITSKKIISNTIFLKNFDHLNKIESRIVMIENADPGFDWIFSKNPSGLITKFGGMASHMAIRCAELNLPAAIGCGEILFNQLKQSEKISLDCKNMDILILNFKEKNDYSDERKLLKSLGYIK